MYTELWTQYWIVQAYQWGKDALPHQVVMAAEIIANYITNNNNNNIRGFDSQLGEHEISQFAFTIATDSNSEDEVLNALSAFSNISGLKINKDETEIIEITNWKYANIESW